MTVDEELATLQQEMYEQAINMPEELEERIIEIASQVANYLYFHANKGYEIEFGDDILRFTPIIKTCVGFQFYLISKVEVKTEDKTRRFKLEAEYENELSLLENYRAIIACFLRDFYCGPKAEIISDEQDT